MSAVPFDVQAHVALRRVAALAASPCGRWLAVQVERLDSDGAKYAADLWRVPTDGGAATQLTRGDSRDTAPCFRHDGALGFLSNRRPSEGKADDDSDQRAQIWLLPAEGGEPRQLTDEPLGVEQFRFARDADRLVALVPVLADVPAAEQRETASRRAKHGPSARRFTRQPVRHWDHWLHEGTDRGCVHLIAYDAEGRARVDLTPRATRELAIDPQLAVSDDGRHLVVSQITTGKDRVHDVALQLFDLDAGSSRMLAQADSTSFADPHFAPDGRTLAAARGERSPRGLRHALTLIDVATGGSRDVASDWDRWPYPVGFSRDGATLFATADHEGDLPIFGVSLATQKVERLTSAASGGAHAHVAVLADGRLACIRSTLLDAPECHVVDATADRALRPLARLSGFTPAHAWAEVERLAVRSTDGASIQGFLIRPRQRSGPLPVLLWIHGGPIAMSVDGWHWRWNPLLAVAQGYAVVETNPRGSTGFGQRFVDGIWGNVWGAQCYQDLMAVSDAVAARPDVDASRMMAMGGSFGGYMTNWIGTQTARFRCLITHASIVGMSTFTGVTDHPAWWYLEMGGENPYANPDGFDRFAPWKQVARWKTPALIIHGERDYRCPIGEALLLFEALQYHGVESELLVFPDEGHWIVKPRNIVAWYSHVLEFLRRFMA